MITLSIHLNRIHSLHKKVLSLAPAHPQSFFRLVLILLSIDACCWNSGDSFPIALLEYVMPIMVHTLITKANKDQPRLDRNATSELFSQMHQFCLILQAKHFQVGEEQDFIFLFK